MSIFLDSGFYIALYNKKDYLHVASSSIYKKIKENIYTRAFTSTFVLDETLTYIQRKVSKELAANLAKIWLIDNTGFADIIQVDSKIIAKSVKLFIKQENERKPLSFTDCTNIYVCKQSDIKFIASFDNEFSPFLSVIKK